MKKITYKGFTIESDFNETSDPQYTTDISKTIKGTFYCASIGGAENEGLSDEDGESIPCPQSVIDKAYDLEESL